MLLWRPFQLEGRSVICCCHLLMCSQIPLWRSLLGGNGQRQPWDGAVRNICIFALFSWHTSILNFTFPVLFYKLYVYPSYPLFPYLVCPFYIELLSSFNPPTFSPSSPHSISSASFPFISFSYFLPSFLLSLIAATNPRIHSLLLPSFQGQSLN